MKFYNFKSQIEFRSRLLCLFYFCFRYSFVITVHNLTILYLSYILILLFVKIIVICRNTIYHPIWNMNKWNFIKMRWPYYSKKKYKLNSIDLMRNTGYLTHDIIIIRVKMIEWYMTNAESCSIPSLLDCSQFFQQD